MAVTYGFFNSVNGDRKYDADQMSEFYNGIVTEGVFQHVDNGLAVTAGTGMTVSVSTGRAIIQNKWVKNDAVLTLDVGAASPVAERVDAVVIRFNSANRNVSIVVKQGGADAPEMTRTGGVYEMALAYVNVQPNETTVIVVDKRSDSSVCGWAAVAQSTSGEVDTMLNDLKTGYDGVIYDTPAAEVRGSDQKLQNQITQETGNNGITDYEMGHYITTNVSPVDITSRGSGSWFCKIIDCSAGDSFTISGTGGAGSRLWAFIDSNNNLLDLSAANAVEKDLIITAPANSSKLILNFNSNYDWKSFYGKEINGKIERNSVNISNLQTRMSNAEDLLALVRVGDFEAGKYIATNGSSFNPSSRGSGSYYCKIVPCQAGDSFTIVSGTGGFSPRLWAFAKSDNTILDPRAGANASANNLIITAPENATQLVLNFTSAPGYPVVYYGKTVDARIKVVDDKLIPINEDCAKIDPLEHRVAVLEQEGGGDVPEYAYPYTTPEKFKDESDPDDTLSFQAAVDYAVQNDCLLLLSAKTYILSNQITISGRIVIYGGGAVLQFAANTNGLIMTGYGAYSVFKDMRITSLSTESQYRQNEKTGLKVAGDHLSLENVIVEYFYYGIYYTSTYSSSNQTGSVIMNCHVRWIGHTGMYLGEPQNNKATDFYIIGCTIYGDIIGLYVGSCIGYKISDLHLWGYYNHAMELEDCSITNFNNIYFESASNVSVPLVRCKTRKGNNWNNIVFIATGRTSLVHLECAGREESNFSNIQIRSYVAVPQTIFSFGGAGTHKVNISNVTETEGDGFVYGSGENAHIYAPYYEEVVA